MKQKSKSKGQGKRTAPLKTSRQKAAAPLTPEEVILQRRRRLADREEVTSFLSRLAGLAVLLWILFGFVFGITPMRNDDMTPRISAGDLMLYYRLADTWHADDVVVFEKDGTQYTGRIIGKGGEGKSRIGLVLKKLMGDAISNGSIQKIETSRFARADLEHRLLMVDDDMDMNALPKTNYLKSIVTAEAKMDVERKGIQSYQSDLYARFLGFGNGALTSLYDHSDGFWRRQLILTTKERPADREDDPFLIEKLCEELEGILLWCLEGLTRLLRNNYKFTVSARAAGNLDTVKRSSNNVLDFLESEGYFCFKADAEVSSRCLYEVYKVWCDDNACRPVSPNRLSTELNQNSLRYNLEATNNIYLPGGRRVRGFIGIEALIHPCQQ